nr:helix-hairpin-helix domain-containing protein [Clostridia bacterium]
KEMTAMTLTEIPGIGKKTATDLLKHFKTLKAVREATVEELKAVEGIGAKTAESIYNYYRQ